MEGNEEEEEGKRMGTWGKCGRTGHSYIYIGVCEREKEHYVGSVYVRE